MGLRLALDVNRYSDLGRGDPVAIEAIRRADQVALPFVVLAELRCGFRLGTRNQKNERMLTRFIHSYRASLLYPDEATTHIYADILAGLRRDGTPIPTNDIWIAALVIQHEYVLFSRDKHFDAIPHLARL